MSPVSQATSSLGTLRPSRRKDSILWLAAGSAVFALAVLLFTPLRMGLGWDETVYASQISQHVPIMFWGSERARGVPLLVAPVTLITGSVTVLRVYLAVLAGAGLFLALLAWRGLRPAWVLGLAALIFGGLWVAQSQAPRLYPNYWIAVSGLAGAGLFLHLMGKPSRWRLAALAAAAAFAALMRPADAVFLFGPVLAVAVIVAGRRYLAHEQPARKQMAELPAAAAIAAGLAVGLGEWLMESYLYFKGPLARLHAASMATGGTRFDPVTSLRILGGGRASSLPGYPGSTGWNHPQLLWWWLAFAVLAAVGVAAAGRLGWLAALTPVLCAASVYLLYSLPVRDNARYLLPVWALLAVPAATGIAWLASRSRPVAIAAAIVFLATEWVTQHPLLTSTSTALEAAASANAQAAQALQRVGVHPPCTVTTMNRPYFAAVSEPAAYSLSCQFLPSLHRVRPGGQVVVLAQGAGHPQGQAWHSYRLGGGLTAYVRRSAP